MNNVEEKMNVKSDIDKILEEASYYESIFDTVNEKKAINRGLLTSIDNYEFYYMYGLMEEVFNCNTAFLCFEHALFLCDNEDDYRIIEQEKNKMEKEPGFCVHGTSIIILSYNNLDIMKENLEAIYRFANIGGSNSEVIVVDNKSTDEVTEFLSVQDDIKFIKNDENMGFSYGCNQGFNIAKKENDILLLNNDAVLMPNSLFFLRMALYESPEIGASGAVSNNALLQIVSEKLQEDLSVRNNPDISMRIKKAIEKSCKINLFIDRALEDRTRLTGFCVLIKRIAADIVSINKKADNSELLDEYFSPAYFEDDDLGIRLAKAGFRQVLCHNAFVYHVGGENDGKSFDNSQKKKDNSVSLIEIGREKFQKKWGFDIWSYISFDENMLEKLSRMYLETDSFTLLEIGCGMGAFLSAVAYRFPNAKVFGVENFALVAGIGKRMGNITSCNIEKGEWNYPENFFDVICVHDSIQNTENPKAFEEKIKKYLKDGGEIFY